MAATDVVIKCEEFMENEVHPEDENTYFNIYESRDDTEHENDENRRDDNDNENYENDDIKMQELLREFDLEILFTILKFGDITYRSLKYISENDINAAIRSIAYRAEFREKLFAWRRDKYGLNDLSVLPPPKRPSTLMPLGVNNSNNIPTLNTNINNTNAPSRVTSSPYDHMTTTTTNAKQQPSGKAPRTRRLSTPKTNSAKKPRITNQVQEKQDVRAPNSSPPPRSPTPTASQPMTSPTPTLSDTMSLLQQETTRIDSHPSMDYDDPLCYQPTTSSAAAAATQPTGSMKSEASATPNLQPKMAFEKLCSKTKKKRNRGCTGYVWSKEKTLQLIKLFKQHQDLWNPAAEFNKNYLHKQSILSKISSVLGIDVDETASKIHNLRCQYNGVLRKMRKQKKLQQGSNVLIPPMPCWKFYNALNFLSTAKEYKRSAKLSKSVNKVQCDILIGRMQENPDIARGYAKENREKLNELWKSLLLELNDAGPPFKSACEWKKVWTDQKRYVRKKAVANKQRRTGTSYLTQKLTPAKEMIFELVGMEDQVDNVSYSRKCRRKSLNYQEN